MDINTTGTTANGSSGNDNLVTGPLDDTLYGFDGNDTLDGGAGNDLLVGGDGVDTYVFGMGSGHDTINAGDGWYDQPGVAPVDKVQLGAGIAPANFTLARVGSDLVLRLPGGNDSLTLQSYYDSGNYYGYSRVQLQFANGTLWGEAEIAAQLVHVDGSLGDDYLYGTIATDSMQGGQGNDWIYAGDNADTLLGGEGHDSLFGEQGNDLLDGGSGNDSLAGGDGADTYLFGTGSGRDTINASDSWYDQPGVAPVDTVRLGAGIAPADVKLSRVGGDLVLSLAGSNDSLTVQGYYYNYGNDYYGYTRVQLQFADGTLWGIAEIAAQLIHVDGSPGNDGLYGTVATDSMQGGQGNDWIYAGDNADTLLGGAGHDSLYGEQGDDLLDGGAGNDWLAGGDGADSYVFGIGSGHDTVDASDSWYDQQGVAPVDTLRIGAGIAPADLTLARVGNHLVLRLAGGNDSLTVQDYYSYSNNYYGYARVQLQFANGTLWSAAEIAAQIIHVDGTPGNDGLYGTVATDSIQGGQGNDQIWAGDNADTLLGGEGHDSLFGEQGNDLLDGGSGNDSLWGGDGADAYVFGIGSGHDTVYASDGWYGQTPIAPIDTVRLGTGIAPADLTLTRAGSDLVLSLAGGNDSLTVQGYYSSNANYDGNSRIQLQFASGTVWGNAQIAAQIIHVEGSPGDDGLYGTTATDSMQGGQGNDWMVGAENADTLRGGDGNDNLLGDEGSDLLDGGTGNDRLIGGNGADTYVFGIGAGHDRIDVSDGWYSNPVGAAPVDTVQLGAGIAPADFALARSGDDLVLSLPGGDDSLTVQGYYSYLGDFYGYTRVQLQFANGTLWDQGELWAMAGGLQRVEPPAGQYIYGTAGDDDLTGGVGADTLYGEAGNDQLDGGEGNDWLAGSDGTDIYVFGIGSGQDTVDASDGWQWGSQVDAPAVDTVQLGQGILPADLKLARVGDDLVLSLAGSDDSLTLYRYYSSYPVEYGYSRVQLQFADGTVWDANDIAAQVIHVDGSPGNDGLYGTVATDSVQGGEGNDLLDGLAGNDTLAGGEGHDSLYGGAGDDRLDGGEGNDYSAGDDGADTYVFGIGSGHDTVSAYDYWYLTSQENPAPIDTVQFGAGIAPADLELARVGSDLVLSLAGGGGDSLTVQGYYTYDSAYYGQSRVQLQFANGTLWGAADIAAQLIHVDGSPGNDGLYGTVATDSMQGGQGNDWIWAGDKADTLLGGEGHDSLFGEQGNDLLDGGAGNDSLMGGDGADSYVFGIGSGRDTVDASDSWYGQAGVAPVDTVRIGAGIAPADLKLSRVGGDLVLSLSGGSDSLTVQGYYYYDNAYYGYTRVQLQFADGTLWGAAEISAQVIHVDGTPGNDGLNGTIATDSMQGGQGNDQISAGDNADTLLGGAGHDSLYGDQGNDLLDGGAGNDSLMGGDGSDSYVFGIGSGHDTVDASDGWYGQTTTAPFDKVQLGAGIAPADFTLARAGDDLVLSLAGGNDSLTVHGYYSYEAAYYGQSRIQLQFADGAIWGAAEIAAQLIHVDGSPGNDWLYGTVATDSMQGGQANDQIWAAGNADTLRGGEGHDSLFGEQGNDLLDGGSGNDFLMGGDGADTYVFGIGSGHDTVDATDSWLGQQGVAPTDIVRLDASLVPADFTQTQIGDDLVLSLTGGADSLTVRGYYSYNAAYYGQSRIQFQYAPTASDSSVTFNEDTSKTFAVADFGFSDVNAGDSLQSVTVTTLETLGALKLNGVDVTLNQVISAADITAGKLTYTPVANGNGTGYASFGFKVSDGIQNSASAYTMTLNVTPVNDAPTGAVTISGTATQGQTLTASNTLADVDGLGTISYQWLADGTAITGATASTFTLTQAQVGKAMSVKASYTDSQGTAESKISLATTAVANINDAPTASNRAVTFNEDTVKTFALADFGFSDVDVGDSLQSVTVTTLETLGALKLNGVDVTLNQVISAADITAGKLTYTPVANGNGTGYASFGFKVSDGSLSSTSAYTMTLNVTPVNDAPTASNRSVTFNEDTVKTFALADFGFSDVDVGDSLQSVTVTTLETLGALKLNGVDVTLNQVISAADITAGKLTYTPVANGNGTGYASFGFKVSDGSLSSTSAYTMTLNVTPVNDAPTASNRSVTFNEDTVKTFALADFGFSDVDVGDSLQSVTVTTLETLGALKLNGVDVTLNQVISAADITAGKLTYTPVANGNGTGYASFGFTVSDGSLSSTSAYTMTLNVAPINDAPTASNRAVTFNEDTVKTFALADFGFSDVDAGDSLQSVTVTTLETLGALKLNGVDVTLNQVISAADITAGKLTYTPVANGNGTGYASFGFTVSDGSLSSTSAYTMTLNVTPVNDAPTASNRSVTFNEDTVKTFAVADFGFSDVDAGDSLQSVTVTTLEALGALKLNGVDVTLNQVISAADITAGKLTYTPVANGNGTGYASFGFKVSDGLLGSTSAYTMTLNVTPVNDAPTGAVTISGTATQGQTLTASNTLADVDGLGTISYQWLADGTAITGATASTFTLTQAQVGKAMSVKASYTDSQGTAESKISLATTAVANINDAPTASNRAVTFNEDTVKTFALADFGFSDVDAGDSLQSVTVTTLETLGALKLNGVDVTLNQVISAADITAGKLTYTPVANGNGTGYASFGFTVSDGSLSSTSAYTMTLNVTPVNDAPTASNRSVTFNEDTVKTFAVADFGFSDVDAGDSLQSVTVTTLEALGALKLNGVDVTLNQVISAADITAGKLTYTPVANGNGTGYASFGFKVSDGLLGSTSAYTMTLNVTPVNDAPTGAVTISGTAKQGQTLTAANTLADVDGLGTISYQWLADGAAITGATASTFTLTQAQVGKAVSVKASYTDGKGTAESVTSAATLSVVKSGTSVPFSDYNGDGKADLRWVNDSGEVSLWLMNGANPSAKGNFLPAAGWSVKDGSRDFNGDGKTDLLLTNANGAAAVWTMNGLTALAKAEHGPYAGWKLVDAAGDYNGDGKADLRWVKDSGEISLWLMNGTMPTATANFGPFSGWSVKDGSRDFNGDGKTDLLLTNANGAAAVWTMNGLTAIAKAEHGPYAGWKLVDAAGDYNGDGKADLRWVKDSGEISLWLMNGTMPTATANFGPFSGWSVKDGSRDFNGDGKSDLLLTNANGAAAIWTMNGLTAIAKAEFGPYAGWKLVDAAGDYNGDGKADLRWVKDSGEIALWLMNGTAPITTANFGPYDGWRVKDGSQDLNGDGKTDLLWTHTSGVTSIWTMDGVMPTATVNHGPFAGWRLDGLQPSTVAGSWKFVDSAGDYNGDGKADLRWVSDKGEVSLWLMNGGSPIGAASFGPFEGWSVKDGSQDFNGDGKSDLLWTNTSGAASIWTMNGLGAIAKAELTPGTGWKLVDAVGDYNGDGKADLRWVKDSGEVSLWLMNGTSATAKVNFGPFNGWSVKDGSQDFNGDGKSDLLWTNTNGAASIWTMNGLSATAIVDHGPYAGWKLVDAAGDYNGDGKADLRWVKDNGEVSLWLMNGTVPSATRNFALPSGWSVKDGSRDFNGDGKSDLLLTNTNGAASVWTMNGLNATAQANHGPFAGWKLADAAGDYNGDGKADLRWVKDNGEISLWLMNGVNAMATANFDPADGLSVKDGSQDLNGDGKTDLLWTDASGAESAWLMDGVSLVGTVNPGDLPGWALI